MVMGKVESGVLSKGQELLLMPNSLSVQVLQCFADETEEDRLYSGDNCRLKLKGVDEASIQPGFVLCSPESPCSVGRVFDAKVAIQEHKSIIAAGYSCVLHIHAAVEDVTVKVGLVACW